MAEPGSQRMTVEAFLAWEAEQEERYELVDGRPVAMTGGTLAHDIVRLGIGAELRARLREASCRAHMDVKISCPTGNIRYPDASVDCSPLEPRSLVQSEPRHVFEVLSPSTRATDFLIKVRDYESVRSIRTYVILWQDEPRSRLHRRVAGGLSVEEIVGLDGSIALFDPNVVLPMAAIYQGLFS